MLARPVARALKRGNARALEKAFNASSSSIASSASPSSSSTTLAYSANNVQTTRLPSHCHSARHLHTTSRLNSSWPAGAQVEEDGEASTSSTVADNDNVEVHISTGSGAQERRPSRLSQSAPIDRTDAGSSKTRSRLEMPKSKPAKTLLQLNNMKQQGKPIACLTAYDYPSALSLRHSDIDICLVGDSLANVALGHASTQQLTLEATIHHCQAVHRGLFSPVLSVAEYTPGAPLLIADVPFGAFQASEDEGVRSAIRLLKEGGVDGVKIEGGLEIIPLVRRLTQFGIPVMGHLGLQPQRVGSSAGYRLQGRTSSEAFTILEEALALQEAGVFSIVLECIPNRVGEIISKKLRVPTIGIGAGPQTDGQILVTNDMLGELTSPWHVIMGLETEPASSSSTSTLASSDESSSHSEPQPQSQSQSQSQSHNSSSNPPPTLSPTFPLPQLHSSSPAGPKFVRNFVSTLVPSSSSSSPTTMAKGNYGIGALRLAAVSAYVDAVRDRTFPNEEKEGYKIKGEELREFTRKIAEAGY